MNQEKYYQKLNWMVETEGNKILDKDENEIKIKA